MTIAKKRDPTYRIESHHLNRLRYLRDDAKRLLDIGVTQERLINYEALDAVVKFIEEL